MKGRKLAAMLLSVWLLLSQLPTLAIAKNDSYQYDEKQQSIPAPDAYTVDKVYYGGSFGTGSLSNAMDLFVDDKQNLYIADSGNNRILVVGADGKLVKEIKSIDSPDKVAELNNPQGIFKAQDGLLYICDTGNSRVVAVDDSGKVQRLIVGESMISVNKDLAFTPEKVVVDSDHNVFVVSAAIYQGIMRFDRNNQFQSFYAPNQVQTTVSVLMLSMWKKIFTSEQSNMIDKSLPASYNNVDMDQEGFVYATSLQAMEGLELKKLNKVGDNILKIAGKSSGKIFGDYDIVVKDKQAVTNSFVDVNVDDENIITLADTNTGKMFQYDSDGNLVSIFGGNGDQKGQFKRVSSVEKWNGKYLVLDQDKNSITAFRPTPYILKVRSALRSYHNGLYVESKNSWEEILRENSSLLIAYRSIGRAELQEGKYKEAMAALKKGNDAYFYSLTLKEYRKEFVRKNFLLVILGIVVIIAGFIWLCKFIKKKLLQ